MKYLIVLTLFFVATLTNAQDALVIDVKIQGNKKLKSAFVKKITKIEVGTTLDSTLIEDDIKRLKRLPAVAHAYYQVELSHDNSYKVFYNIEENFTIIPTLSVYTTNDNEFAYRLGLYEFNALGQNITVGGFYQKDIFRSYGINLRAPFLFNREFGIAINHQDLNTQEPVFFDNTTADYKYRNKSYEVLGLFQPNLKNRFEVGINYFLEEYQYLNGATNPIVPQELSVKKLLYKGVYEFNNLDYYFHYISGFKSMLSLQYVTSTSDDLPEFVIGWNDFNYYKRIGAKGNWASRIRVGFSSNDETPFAPFSVDNNLNIRGVGNTIDRGTGALVINTEYRHTIFEKNWFVLQGNAFVDAGSWRNPGGDLGDFGKSQNIRIYPGLGLRFIHKRIFNAIFRIDYGFGVTNGDTQGLVFGVGQYF
jgi:outer membrane protein assembly factor BamA